MPFCQSNILIFLHRCATAQRPSVQPRGDLDEEGDLAPIIGERMRTPALRGEPARERDLGRVGRGRERPRGECEACGDREA